MAKTILRLDELQSQALATLARRFGYRDALDLSSSKEEAALMMKSMNEVQTQLEYQGQ